MNEITIQFLDGSSLTLEDPDAVEVYGWWRYETSDRITIGCCVIERESVFDIIGVPLCYEGGCK